MITADRFTIELCIPCYLLKHQQRLLIYYHYDEVSEKSLAITPILGVTLICEKFFFRQLYAERLPIPPVNTTLQRKYKAYNSLAKRKK